MGAQLLSGDPQGRGSDPLVESGRHQFPTCRHRIPREQELVQLRASQAPVPGGQEPPATFQPLKVAFGDSLEGQADDPCLPVGPRPFLSLPSSPHLQVGGGKRRLKEGFDGSEWISQLASLPWTEPGLLHTWCLPCLSVLYGVNLCIICPQISATALEPQSRGASKKSWQLGQCQGRMMMWRLRPIATREQIHSLALQHKRLRSVPCPPPVSWAILAQRAWTDRPQGR